MQHRTIRFLHRTKLSVLCGIALEKNKKIYQKEIIIMEKRLYKIRQGKILAGVCNGIGQYFNVDPNLIRLGAVLLGCTGTGVIAYIIAAIILPEA